MQTTLRIKNINSITHESIEFISIFVYFSDINKDERTILTLIMKQIYVVNDLKVKMLIEKDFFDFEEFMINMKKIITIDNCRINISLKVQSKDLYITKTVYV